MSKLTYFILLCLSAAQTVVKCLAYDDAFEGGAVCLTTDGRSYFVTPVDFPDVLTFYIFKTGLSCGPDPTYTLLNTTATPLGTRCYRYAGINPTIYTDVNEGSLYATRVVNRTCDPFPQAYNDINQFNSFCPDQLPSSSSSISTSTSPTSSSTVRTSTTPTTSTSATATPSGGPTFSNNTDNTGNTGNTNIDINVGQTINAELNVNLGGSSNASPNPPVVQQVPNFQPGGGYGGRFGSFGTEGSGSGSGTVAATSSGSVSTFCILVSYQPLSPAPKYLVGTADGCSVIGNTCDRRFFYNSDGNLAHYMDSVANAVPWKFFNVSSVCLKNITSGGGAVESIDINLRTQTSGSSNITGPRLFGYRAGQGSFVYLPAALGNGVDRIDLNLGSA